jgi:hypothetical protein
MSSTTPTIDDEAPSPASDADTWGTVGRELLYERLERDGEATVRDAFRKARTRIGSDGALTRQDVQAMRHALTTAERTVELAAKVTPDTASQPDLWSFLDDDARTAYIAEVTRRRKD